MDDSGTQKMSEFRLMAYLIDTFRENRQIRTIKRITRKYGDLEEWKEFAEHTTDLKTGESFVEDEGQEYDVKDEDFEDEEEDNLDEYREREIIARYKR
jgi:hypothetical protein